MPTKKHKSLARVVDEYAGLLQKLVRLKAADPQGYCVCVTCRPPQVFHWKEMDGGHFISRGKSATKVLEENIHPQCKGCNMTSKFNSLITMYYEEYMVDMYGKDEVERMKKLAILPHKHDRQDIESRMSEVRDQIRELEAQL